MTIIIQEEEYVPGEDTFQVLKSNGKDVFDPIYTLIRIDEIKGDDVIICTHPVKKEGKVIPEGNYFPITTQIRKCSN